MGWQIPLAVSPVRRVAAVWRGFLPVSYTHLSALWPFSTLGWPEKTPELDYFYPTSTLVTGYDIIFFWVARMIFSGVEHMGETPFETVYIHGLVRDCLLYTSSMSVSFPILPVGFCYKQHNTNRVKSKALSAEKQGEIFYQSWKG